VLAGRVGDFSLLTHATEPSAVWKVINLDLDLAIPHLVSNFIAIQLCG
jgi:hypothetical protein